MKFHEKVLLPVRAMRKMNNKSNLLKKIEIEYRNNGITGIKRKIVEVANRQDVITHSGTSYDINMQIFHDQQNELTFKEMEARIKSFRCKPLVSIIMPVYNVPLKWLECAILSLKNQSYENWELCAVDDCSTDGRVRSALSRYAAEDKRIRVQFSDKNGGISAASNIALNMASGEYIALMDNDDELTPDALFWIANEIDDFPDVDFIYSDECIADDSNHGKKIEFVFKPDWSPESLMGFMYTAHLTVYKTSLVRKLSGFQTKHDIAQDYDLALRVSEVASQIRHVDRVLYVWRAIEGSIAKGGKHTNVRIGANVGLDAMIRRGYDAHVMMRPYGNYYRLNIKNKGKVSIVIPTDSFESANDAILNICQITAYADYEIVVVCNSLVAKDLEREFSYLQCLKVSQFDEEYNYSKKCNQGAERATGDILVFLQDCNRVENGTWLDALIEFLHIKGVGAVSPQIIRIDNTIRYAGMISGAFGLTGIPYNGVHKDSYDEYWTRHRWIRNVTVLSASCIAIKKENFERINGFDQINTPTRYSNADLSYKLLEVGLRCVYNPHVVLRNASTQWWDSWFFSPLSCGEHVFLLKKWGKYLSSDPYFTKAMQRAIVRDLPYEYNVFNNAEQKVDFEAYAGKNVLLVSHELSMTGAPVVLHYAARAIIEGGGFPVVISPKDGMLRSELVNDGITVIVDPLLYSQHWYFERFASSFDLMIVNTLVPSAVIKQFEDKKVPILWWIHEGELSFTYLDKFVPKHVGKNVRIFCGGEYSKAVFHKHRKGMDSEVLLYGVPDHVKNTFAKVTNDRIVFSIIGTIDRRKGQDIFVKAIEIMPKEYRNKAEFWIIGATHEADVEEEVASAAKKIPQIKRIKEMSRDDLTNVYNKTDVIVTPSRDDPMPVVMTEGMIFSKVCICSTSTGTASLINDSVNGFIIKTGDYVGLSKKMMHIIDHPDQMNLIGKEARKIYEENFTMKMFNEKLNAIVQEMAL